jgi:predicted transcriptional regulator
MVHNDVVAASNIVRQSISLPSDVAKRVKTMAKNRRLSSNRMLVELVEDGLEAQRRKEEDFFALAERFRAADNPKDVQRLGDELGRMVFGR